MAASASAAFKASRFRVRLETDDGEQRVTVAVGVDGLKVMNEQGTLTMRSLDLKHISRWSTMGSDALVIYTQTPVDLEERQLLLSGDARTVQSLLDTLTCSCMQLAELLQQEGASSGRGGGYDADAGHHLGGLVAGGGRKKAASPSLPPADAVEYWHGAEKSGWLHSQGDVVKTWRKRWFVLKQGYLFRFMGPDVTERDRPRGVVDLSQVQDVRDGRAATGRANSLQLLTARGASVCFLCDTETEMVEWISAIEGAVARIVKLLAGVDDGAERGGGGRSGRSGSSRGAKGGGGDADWAAKMERAIEAGTGAGALRRNGSGGGNGRQMVSVVDYGGGGGGMSGGRGGSGGGSYGGYGGGGGGYGGGGDGGISSYSQISGAAGVAGAGAAADDDIALNYGGGGGGGGGGYGGGGYGAAGYGSGGGYGAGGGAPAPADGYGGSAPAYGAPSAYGYGGGGGYGAAAPPAAPGYYDAAAAAGQYGAAAPPAAPQHGGGAPYDPSAAYYAAAPPAPQPQPQPQPQQPGGVSLIDLPPQQAPAYPTYGGAPAYGGGGGYSDAAGAPPAPPQPAPQQQPQPQQQGAAGGAGGWQVHHSADGRPYYYNASTGATTWDAPPGAFL